MWTQALDEKGVPIVGTFLDPLGEEHHCTRCKKGASFHSGHNHYCPKSEYHGKTYDDVLLEKRLRTERKSVPEMPVAQPGSQAAFDRLLSKQASLRKPAPVDAPVTVPHPYNFGHAYEKRMKAATAGKKDTPPSIKQAPTSVEISQPTGIAKSASKESCPSKKILRMPMQIQMPVADVQMVPGGQIDLDAYPELTPECLKKIIHADDAVGSPPSSCLGSIYAIFLHIINNSPKLRGDSNDVIKSSRSHRNKDKCLYWNSIFTP